MLRLVRIGEETDLQPRSGTHIRSRGEIGGLKVLTIDNKGVRNKRIVVVRA